jgi:site-specific DNA-cytosine methylase
LFDGISCGQAAFNKAGIKIDNYYASEINEDSIYITQKNFPNTIQLGDVTKLQEEQLKKLPKIDILIGGSPCQGFSLAGKQLNFNDTRSRLFFEYVRILNWLRQHNNPNILFLLENVKMKQWCVDIISEKLGVEPIEINSVLVSAQRRERLYWTNIKEIEQPESKNIKIKDIIYDNTYKVFTDERIEKTKKFTKNYVKWDLSGKGYGSQQDRAYYLDGTMCTLPHAQPTNKLNIYLGGDKYRRCHPIEAERLQTLPDNYTEGLTDAKRLAAIGDGWTVDVIAHILKHIKINTYKDVINL